MPQLDGVRAFAISLVLLEHFRESVNRNLPLGTIGVFTFFVLSGYLITGILLRSREALLPEGGATMSALARFYARRALRIFPLFYLALAVAVALNLEGARRLWHWNAIYVSNLYFARHGWDGVTSHFWSLCVEEQFYLVWPILILMMPRRWLLPITLAMSVAGVGFRAAFALTTANAVGTKALPFGCLDTLGAGAALAICWHSGVGSCLARKRVLRVALACGLPLVAVATAIWHVQRFQPIAMAMLGAGMAGCGAWLIDGASQGFRGAVGRVLSASPVIFVGGISYGIYVWHNLVAGALKQAALSGTIPILQHGLMTVAELAGTFGVAILSWFLFERPILSLKRFVPSDRSRSKAATRPIAEGAAISA